MGGTSTADEMHEAQGRPVALVTGGSRGIGAATVLALAQRGYDVALTYRNKTSRAETVAAEAQQYGVSALTIRGDMTRPKELQHLLATLRDWRDQLDLLVLNASGGLEREALAADPGYPMRINRDAQIALVEGALPLLSYRPAGAAIVFVTSHWAHLYGRAQQLPVYEAVAASKHAGEVAVRARLPELSARGIRLLIVTADVVEGTITPRLLERATPGLRQTRQDEAGDLPTAEEMGTIIATAATDPTLPTDHLIVIGAALDALPRLDTAQ
ncbi:MAG: SDR family oxidoreductase [Ktedonobacterales bacterium]